MPLACGGANNTNMLGGMNIATLKRLFEYSKVKTPCQKDAHTKRNTITLSTRACGTQSPIGCNDHRNRLSYRVDSLLLRRITILKYVGKSKKR